MVCAVALATNSIPVATGEEGMSGVRHGGGLMPNCVGMGGCTRASTNDRRSISCVGGACGVAPGIGTLVAGGVLYLALPSL